MADETITDQVKAFRKLFGYTIRTVPTVPPDDEVRLHLRIWADEALELLEAHGLPSWREEIMHAIATHPLNVDLVKVADACGDVDYTVEGLRQCYGIPRQAIADEIQRSNIAKRGGLVVNGKQMKPEGWQPPDISGILERAGGQVAKVAKTQSINVPGPGKPGHQIDGAGEKDLGQGPVGGKA